MSEYTITVNNTVFELSEDFRESIQRRARGEYRGNALFECWWKVEDGDPKLVIETEGLMVPWDKLDQLEPDGPGRETGQSNSGSKNDIDSGNGMATLPPDDVSDSEEKEHDRTHFAVTPQNYEEVPSPDGEDPERIPPEPEEMGDEPKLVAWVPDDPEREEVWNAGKAIMPMNSWVEWNIQARADEVGHDHYESLCVAHECEKVGTQKSPEPEPSGSVKRKGEDQFENGKYGGDNWRI